MDSLNLRTSGLLFFPALLPESTQKYLLTRLMHDMLADPCHKTNVHAHHIIPYHAAYGSSSLTTNPPVEGEASDVTPVQFERSFFNMSPNSSELFEPLDPETHSPMNVLQFLHKRLRWLTLGLQYDWTKKCYTEKGSPPFPEDLATFTQNIFPEMRAEAAIVNMYSPGDTLSVHRDVSEESARGLVSFSLGCDAIFVAGTVEEGGKNPKTVAVRLRSGDAILMSGLSRFAWHGVPQIIANTCPEWLKSWPADEISHVYDEWHGWMLDKRVNLSVRQVRD